MRHTDKKQILEMLDNIDKDIGEIWSSEEVTALHLIYPLSKLADVVRAIAKDISAE